MAVTRAARGWAAEMLCETGAENENTWVWLGGDYLGVAAIHDYLTGVLGLADDAITSRGEYRLGS